MGFRAEKTWKGQQIQGCMLMRTGSDEFRKWPGEDILPGALKCPLPQKM